MQIYELYDTSVVAGLPMDRHKQAERAREWALATVESCNRDIYTKITTITPVYAYLHTERSPRSETSCSFQRQLTRMALNPVGWTLEAANKPHELHTSSQSTCATLRILGNAGSPYFDVHAGLRLRRWEPKGGDHQPLNAG